MDITAVEPSNPGFRFLLFLAGQALWTGFHWALWKQPGRNWKAYWADHSAPTIANLLLSVLILLIWRGGALGPVLKAMHVDVDAELINTEISDVLCAPLGAGFAILATLITKRFFPTPERKETP